LALGWDGRLAVLGIAALFGLAAEGVAALAAYLAVIFIGGSLIGTVLPPERRISSEPLEPELPAAKPVAADPHAPAV
jgi:hypothetical protein